MEIQKQKKKISDHPTVYNIYCLTSHFSIKKRLFLKLFSHLTAMNCEKIWCFVATKYMKIEFQEIFHALIIDIFFRELKRITWLLKKRSVLFLCEIASGGWYRDSGMIWKREALDWTNIYIHIDNNDNGSLWLLWPRSRAGCVYRNLVYIYFFSHRRSMRPWMCAGGVNILKYVSSGQQKQQQSVWDYQGRITIGPDGQLGTCH